MSETATVWDHVIVGAGSAGAVTAARLAATGAHVLLLEAGSDQPTDPGANPLRDASKLILEGYNWDYRANLRTSTRLADLLRTGAPDNSPETEARRTRALWSRFPYQLGKVVGGSSAVNGALAMRGLPRDFDDWVAHGNPDWSWEQVLPFYKAIENDPDFPGSLHGDSGPLPIRRPAPEQLHALDAAFWAECTRLGVTDLPDLNSGHQDGVGTVPSNALHGERVDAATVYLTGPRTLPNLQIRTHTRVTRVLFEGHRAVGVELLEDGRPTTVAARNVTLSAGAIGTPAILQRSGVASAALSTTLGITPVADLPGVGENLADHPSVVIWSQPKPGVCTPGLPWRQVAARMSSGFDDDTDIQMGLLNNVDSQTIPGFIDRLGWPMVVGISVMLLRPASHGRVFLEDAGPHSRPVIELGLGTATDDIERLAHGVRKAWRVLRSDGMGSRLDQTQFWTDAMVANDKILRSGVRNIMNPGWHAVGSARMGPATDPMAVVDQNCHVHHTENLRVVDASVFPTIPSAPTNLTTLMLAERIASSTKE
ncbi:GMC family oxidoreductase [Streptomyces celluloflavus]|uniref:GMC family oxidoreductase n=1 Tax=Streptomyces TaxID=1883 RepID=UPI000699D959|nr:MULTISPECIES: GMC family oxidoreductase [Streptomyces]MYU56619.1 NAD(P)-binding protein [Streptomyces sp. SID7805]